MEPILTIAPLRPSAISRLQKDCAHIHSLFRLVLVTSSHCLSVSSVNGTIVYIVGNTDRLSVRGNVLTGDEGTGISAGLRNSG